MFGLCERLRVDHKPEVVERIAKSKVAKRLDRYIADNGIDYRTLAQKLKVTLSQAHDWATGVHAPNLGSVRRIAKRLRIEISELV